MAIECPRCQTRNPGDARFCLNCGLALGGICSNCGAALAPGARFCHRCGSAVTSIAGAVQPTQALPASSGTPGASIVPGPGQYLGSSTARDRLHHYVPPQLLSKLEAGRTNPGMEAERRIVTVLFCDVSGSTAIADQLDPEDWASLMNRAFSYLITPIYRYEGTLARLMGDAILAFFGAPIAHEDDPQRAILAGLEIIAGIQEYREQLRHERGFEFNVRVGINTGLVVVGEVGSDLRVEYTAMGDAVNLAARLEETAEPGTVQISEQTYKLVEPLIDVEPVRHIPVKGKAQPVPAYRVLRPKPDAAPIRGITGFDSPLVGREDELARLRASADALLAGRGQIVAVLGEAGLGKSRLVAEMRRSLLAAGTLAEGQSQTAGSLRWYEGRSLSYQMMTPYAPFVSVLTACLGLMPETGAAEQYAQIERRVTEVRPEEAATLSPFLATLLGVAVPDEISHWIRDLEPAALRERVFATVEAYLAARAQQQPLLLVFEDLHWADPTSLDLLERLMGLTDVVPLMLLAVFRPQRQERSWRFHEAATRDYPHRYTAIQLQPLDQDEASQLVTNLLHVEGLSDEVRGLILDKTEGNPFFVEEFIRSLLDTGAICWEDGRLVSAAAIRDLSVPATLEGVLTARLDRLDDATKHVAQIAAVIGREFPLAVLRRVHGEDGEIGLALRELQRREIIRERARLPEPIYVFKHVLMQETAYRSLLLSRRRELHRLVAEALEVLNLEGFGEIQPLLAYHFGRADEWSRALAYAEQAAQLAQAASANLEARNYYNQALHYAEQAPANLDVRQRLHRERGQLLDTLGDFEAALLDFETALLLAREANDRRGEWQALLNLGNHWSGLDYSHAGAYFEQALDLARASDDQYLIGQSLAQLGGWHLNLDWPIEAARVLREALSIFERLGDKRAIAHAMDLLEVTALVNGDMVQVEREFARTESLLRELGDRKALSSFLAAVSGREGNLAHDTIVVPAGLPSSKVASEAEEALSLAREIGWRSGESFALMELALLRARRGEYAAALQAAQEGLTIAREIDHREWQCGNHFALGVLYQELLHLSRAKEHLEQAVPLARASGSRLWTHLTTGMLASLSIERGDLDGASAALMTLGSDLPMETIGQRHVWVARAQLSLATGEPATAREIVDELFSTALNYETYADIPYLALLRGEALAALGRQDEAELLFHAAQTGGRARGVWPTLWKSYAALGHLYRVLGRTPEARRETEAARAVTERIAAGLSDDNLRSEFLRQASDTLAKLS